MKLDNNKNKQEKPLKEIVKSIFIFITLNIFIILFSYFIDSGFDKDLFIIRLALLNIFAVPLFIYHLTKAIIDFISIRIPIFKPISKFIILVLIINLPIIFISWIKQINIEPTMMLLKAINAIMIPLFLIDLISGIISLMKNTEKGEGAPDESSNTEGKENIENDDSGNTEETEDVLFDEGGNIELDSEQQSFPRKDNNCKIKDNKQSEITEKLSDKKEAVIQIEYNHNNTIETRKKTIL